MAAERERAVGWLLVGILLGPPAVMSTYLGLSRWPSRWFTEGSDWAALLLSLGVGLVCIGRLPVSAAARAAMALVYVPVAGFVLFLYSLYFVGVMFGDWL